MISRPLDTLFLSADRMRDASECLLRQMPPGGRWHRSIERLVAALDQFDADVAIGTGNKVPSPHAGEGSSEADGRG